MSDPLSVAGSAVGVISLGLTVCGELVKYGRAYRDYGEDIHNIAQKAKSLSEILEALEEAIESTKATYPKAAAHLSGQVIGIKERITRLDSVLKRYGPVNATGRVAEKTRNHAKRTVYHFRKEALQGMAADLDSMQTNLQTALSLHSWTQNYQALQEMKQIMLLASTNDQTRPSSLRDCCHGEEKCQFQSATSSNALSIIHLNRPERESTMGRYRSYNRWVGRAIEISLNMTTGAGIFKISPSLKVQTVFSFGSPEFRYVDNILMSLRYKRDFDNSFQRLKSLLSERRLDLSCAMEYGRGTKSLFEELFEVLGTHAISTSNDLQRCRIVEFLMALRAESCSSDCPIILSDYGDRLLKASDIPILTHLVRVGFRFDFPDTLESYAKDNLVFLLPLLDSVIQIPEALKLLCRENAAELRLALQEKRISPNGRVNNRSMIEWAIGWPEGVQILLDFGADPRQEFMMYLLNPGKGRQSSAEILLKAGCFIDPLHLIHVLRFADGEERMMLLVNQLAKRRKKLRCFAERFLPLASIPGSGEKKLLDGSDCREVLELLSDQKISLPHPFTPKAEEFLGIRGKMTVYHRQSSRLCAEALCQAGFVDTDRLDSRGRSPLGSLGPNELAEFPERVKEIIQWHISKGANLHRKLAWGNESVSHVMILAMIERGGYGDWHCESFQLGVIERYLQELIAMGDEFFAPSRVPDGCCCPCSPGGCTAVSAILRELSSESYWWSFHQNVQCQRRVFDFVHEWDQSYWQQPQELIRSLTFNALGLTHKCFAGTGKGNVVMRNGATEDYWHVDDSTDEEWALNEFEDLLKDVQQKFVQLCQPLKEFLPGYWYRRVKDHLLTRQPEDEEHVKDARRMGVELEFCGLTVPDWMENCIARKVEEVNDEGAVDTQLTSIIHTTVSLSLE